MRLRDDLTAAAAARPGPIEDDVPMFQPECSRPSIVRRDNIVFARKQTQLKIALECECSTIYFSPSPWRVYG